MNRRSYKTICLLTIIILGVLAPVTATANSAEPPCLTIIVSDPPQDLILSLQFTDSTRSAPIQLRKEVRAWEAYYRFFYHMDPSVYGSFHDVILIAETGKQSFEYPLPAEAFNSYNNLLTLDIRSQSVTIGQYALRVPLLIAMRVGLTLLIESAVFFVFGYRTRRSWLVFLIINIVTQVFLNVIVTGAGVGSYKMLAFIFIEIIVFVVEMTSFAIFIKEFKKQRAVLYAVAANAASLIAGSFLITYLPV